MRVLIVGAGSVGQLYGYCFQQGGALVDLYVREKYASRAREGFLLYDRKKSLKAPLSFKPSAVFSTPEAIAEESFDAVVLCIPSTGLRGDWFQDFAASIGDALLISLTPGLEDRDFIASFLPDEQVALGLITSVSYPAPLEGETVAHPGTAFWFPPLAPALFQGSRDPLLPFTQTLQRGGMKSKIITDLDAKAGFGSGLLMPLIAVLETRDWSFRALRKDKARLQLLLDAIDETFTLVEALLDSKRPAPTHLLSQTTIKGALIAAPKATPFDLEIYLKLHFTKVGAQTRLFLKDYINLRAQRGMESPAISELLEELSP